MTLSRRRLVERLGLPAARHPGAARSAGRATAGISGALVGARGREALVAEMWPRAADAAVVPPPAPGEIRISSNENPLGPGEQALEALRGAFGDAGRYPTNTQPGMSDLRAILAEVGGARPENVVLGAGSGEILKNAVHCFTGPGRALVTGLPSYEQPMRVATYLNAEIRAIPVRQDGRLDLDGMAEAVDGAGLVFLCNPNNPTGTVHGAGTVAAFVERVRRAAPDAVIHIDEAYHEYVTDPDYSTAVPLAMETPNVFVSRTFSKCFGMAGMRVGYAIGHADVAERLRRYSLTFNTNSLGQIAAYTAIQDGDFVERERARNAEVKEFTVAFFRDRGHEVLDSQTNFLFVDLGRPAAGFREACAAHGVRVGRDFPPFEKTHARISLGTMEEMRRATEVFAEVLGV